MNSARKNGTSHMAARCGKRRNNRIFIRPI
jgi:hypothetical protein